MTAKVNIDGNIVAAHEAMIPVFDRGFLYGDSVYEVTRTCGGIAFAEAEHLGRLRRSATALGMDLRWSDAELAEEIRRTLVASGNAESYIRVMVTRGAGDIGLDPALADRQRLVIIVRELRLPPAEAFHDGVAVAVVGVERVSAKAVDPAVKSGNYLNSVLAVAEAKRRGAYEAIMLDRDGGVAEGSSSNIFVIIGGRLRTPSLQTGILEGITRAKIIELARGARIGFEETRLRPVELYSADEALLTSSVRGVVPVVRVDEVQIGDGRPGPVTRRLMALYDDLLALAARRGQP